MATYVPDEWLPATEPGLSAGSLLQARKLQRLMIGHATELELDAHGRVRLPAELREFAGLDRAVMLIGQGNKFEVWDADRWISRRDTWLQEETEPEGLPAELSTLAL
jgi:MraZ protein